MSSPGGEERPGGAVDSPLLGGGDAIRPEGRGFDQRHLGEVGREDAADADPVIGFQHRRHVAFVIGVDAVHVLHGGDAGEQAFHRADQRARHQFLA
jgi:hypothetical protein